MRTKIQQRLFALQDEKYRAFHSALIPTVDPATVIGVRVPQLRALAQELAGSEAATRFLAALPHKYYEENMLHGLLLERVQGYDSVLAELERFLPCVDNWAVCDALKPRALAADKPRLAAQIRQWAAEGQPLYTRRFALSMLMTHFLDADFAPWCLELAAGITTGEYYLRMMQAWYFATALAKQWDATLPYLDTNRLEKWTHNKTIQKARESYRITAEQKARLKNLRLPSFTAAPLDGATFARMQGKSFKADCTVPRADLRLLRVLHKNLAGETLHGEMVCHRQIAAPLLDIFRQLYDAGYPIERMRLVDDYNAEDEASMAANNSSCFNFRFISFTTTVSKHGQGLAVDINPLYNPYVKTVDGRLNIEPANGAPYVDRTADFPYKITRDDLCCQLFLAAGFTWGGDWPDRKDYQHFEIELEG